MRTIYHGSDHEIRKPIYHGGRKHNDYGYGFYCTENIDLAKEWSVQGNVDGIINIYNIDDSNLKILYLNKKPYGLLNWLAILLNNRTIDLNSYLAIDAQNYILNNFLVDYKNYDVIVGYRADDSYFAFAEDFLKGAISYRQLNSAFSLGKLGLQYVLISKLAHERIIYVGKEDVSKEEWFPKLIIRDHNARMDYHNFEKNRRKPGDIFITNIIDEGMKQNDKRLQ